MPTGQNWLNFTIVSLGFIAQVLALYYFSSVAEIKKNWPQYRCNPLYMPLSDDVQSDFTYCVQNTQVNLMGYLLQPITFVLSYITEIGGQFQNNIQDVRNMFSAVRNFFTSIVENIFSVFSNLVIEFQTISISLKDSLGKIIGIVVSLLYILDGSIKTMNSAWKGPPGQLVKAIGSACFHKDTMLDLDNGIKKKISEVNVGEKLKDGSQIIGVLKLLNKKNEKLYKIKGVKQDILVTGEHFILNKKTNGFVKVKDYEFKEQTDFTENIYYNLITDSSKICIDEQVFWDWEDDVLCK